MEQATQRGWFGRNWIWALPVGCFSMAALSVFCCFGLVFSIFGFIKSSDIYKDAIARAQAEPKVTQALGAPVKEGLFVTGSLKLQNTDGTADLTIPISGPNGKATIYVNAVKSNGVWTYSKLLVVVTGTNEQIDLLATGAE